MGTAKDTTVANTDLVSALRDMLAGADDATLARLVGVVREVVPDYSANLDAIRKRSKSAGEYHKPLVDLAKSERDSDLAYFAAMLDAEYRRAYDAGEPQGKRGRNGEPEYKGHALDAKWNGYTPFCEGGTGFAAGAPVTEAEEAAEVA